MNGKQVIILLFTLAFAAPSMAQRQFVNWSPADGISIRQGYHVEWFRGGEVRKEGDLSGEVAFIWSDTRNGDRGVYMQVVDTEGAQKFDANGLQISDTTGRQEDPAVWFDTDGSWFVAWEDFDADTLGDIYVTKFNANGEKIWGDNERGVPVCVFAGIQEDLRIVQDGEGGCILAWRDWRNGDTGDLYAHHILADGRVDPNWQRNGNPIVVAPGAQISHTADVDGDGGMIIAWKDGRLVGNSDIWAQRVTPEGDMLWGDGEGIPICNQASNQETPKLCPDGAGGAFISWRDERSFQQTNTDIYVQRVNENGELLWGQANQGVPLCTAEQEQIDNRIILVQAGVAMVLWLDKRANGQEYDLYAMKISGANQMQREWEPDQGKPICIAERDQEEARLYPDGQGGAFFTWQDAREGGYPEIDIWAQRVNRSGDQMWEENGVPVCRLPKFQGLPLLRADALGGCVIAWEDHRTGSKEIWGQRLNGNGQPQWAANGASLVSGIGGNATKIQILPRPNDLFNILWLDGRFGGSGTIPFLQLIRNQGERAATVYNMDGIPVIEPNLIGGGIEPDGFTGDDGTTIVAWEDHRQGEVYAIYAQKLDADGDYLWGDHGVKLADFEWEQTGPLACSDGAGGCIAIWRAPTDDDWYDVYAQRLNAEGSRMWGDAGVQVTAHRMDESVQAIVPDGAGGAVVVWLANNRDTDDDLWAQRISAGGESLWGDEGIVIVDEPNKQRSSVLTPHPNGFIVVWVDGRDDEDGQPQNDIYGQLIDLDGTMLWRENGYGICGFEGHQENPATAVDSDENIWVVWEDHRFTGTERARDIYVQKVSAPPDELGRPGEIHFQNDGIPVTAANTDQVEPEIATDGGNGLWVVWEDYRDEGVWSNVYGAHLQPDGTPYDRWQPNGNLISAGYHRQNLPQVGLLRANGHHGVAVVWEDKRATGKEELSDIYIQRVDDDPAAVPDDRKPAAPHGYTLESVYPNPFNSRAFVTFVTSRDGDVQLALYDVSGRLVSEIADVYWSAGRHVIPISAEGIAAGNYFLRLDARGVRLEQGIQLIK